MKKLVVIFIALVLVGCEGSVLEIFKEEYIRTIAKNLLQALSLK